MTDTSAENTDSPQQDPSKNKKSHAAQKTEPQTSMSQNSQGRLTRVQVRKAPKISRFALIGVITGFTVAAFVVYSGPETVVIPGTGQEYTRLTTLGYMSIFYIAIFVTIFVGLGLILDWIFRRKAKDAYVQEQNVNSPTSNDFPE